VLQEGQVAIESRVDRALDRSLVTKSRVTERAKVAKVLPLPVPAAARRAVRAS
jgi:hypothetical protein